MAFEGVVLHLPAQPRDEELLGWHVDDADRRLFAGAPDLQVIQHRHWSGGRLARHRRRRHGRRRVRIGVALQHIHILVAGQHVHLALGQALIFLG